jgi:outer membrane protein assembly factor BamB
VDESGVYFSWGTPKALTLLALNHDGKTKWRADLGPVKGGHGFGASPIIHKDLVILNNDQDGESTLLALDKRTGTLKWETPRRSKRLTYSAPCLYKAPGRNEELIFTNWTHGISGIDPATGKLKWENNVFNQTSKERAIGSPIVAGNLVIGTCGFVTKLKHLVALRPKGDKMEEAWRIEKSVPHIPTPLLLGKNLFLWNDQGIVTCVEPNTGKVHWSERAVRSGRFFGSPITAGGNIFCAESKGKMIVLRGDGKFEVLAENNLGEKCNTTPAVADGVMYVRTYEHLIAIGK